MRLMATACLLVAAGSGNENGGQSRLQIVSPALRELVQAGRERSRTFVELLEEIDRFKWIVVVQTGSCPDRATIGCVLHSVHTVGRSPALRVLVDRRRGRRDEVIASIAHELRHVLEIVSDPSVHDAASIRHLMERISETHYTHRGVRTYETAAARRTGEIVRRELRYPTKQHRNYSCRR